MADYRNKGMIKRNSRQLSLRTIERCQSRPSRPSAETAPGCAFTQKLQWPHCVGCRMAEETGDLSGDEQLRNHLHSGFRSTDTPARHGVRRSCWFAQSLFDWPPWFNRSRCRRHFGRDETALLIGVYSGLRRGTRHLIGLRGIHPAQQIALPHRKPDVQAVLIKIARFRPMSEPGVEIAQPGV
jgi:hypothetical protein